jgi:hypothetical protein
MGEEKEKDMQREGSKEREEEEGKGRTSAVQLNPISPGLVHHLSGVREALDELVDLFDSHRARLGELATERRGAETVARGDGVRVDFDGGLAATVGELSDDEGTLPVEKDA